MAEFKRALAASPTLERMTCGPMVWTRDASGVLLNQAAFEAVTEEALAAWDFWKAAAAFAAAVDAKAAGMHVSVEHMEWAQDTYIAARDRMRSVERAQFSAPVDKLYKEED